MQQLLNPFAQKYPESNEATFPCQAACIKFNPYGPFAGHYIAAGCYDGSVQVWDIETRGVARYLEGHVKTVGCVNWSRNNRYLVSASLDATCIIWDLSILAHPSLRPSTPLTRNAKASSSSQRVHTLRFDAPVSSAEFHPRNSKIILASLTCNEVVLVDLRKGRGKTVLQDVMETDEEGSGEDEGRNKGSLCCAVFSPCGSRIYAGTTRGRVLIIDPVTKFVLERVQVANSAVRQIAFDASGQNLLTSATDRALRLLSVNTLTGALTPFQRFQDAVNRTAWHNIGFSGDGEYVMAGAAHKAGHNIFIWDKEVGQLIKVLEGPRESLGDCVWHPSRPVIASTTMSGDIELWQTSMPDNWAAFAPGFEELEENIEYDEREDEFDIEDETEASRRKDIEEDFDIDILLSDSSYPMRPIPVTTIPVALSATDEDGVESEYARAVRLHLNALNWADEDGRRDGDNWVGFYLSLDLFRSLQGDQILS